MFDGVSFDASNGVNSTSAVNTPTKIAVAATNNSRTRIRYFENFLCDAAAFPDLADPFRPDRLELAGFPGLAGFFLVT